MKTDENLLKQLSTWKAEMELPPRFQANVWTQIAARESNRRSSFWKLLCERFARELYKPHMAAAAITFSLTLSVGAAYLNAQDSNALAGKKLEARYMETINPLAHTNHSA